MTQNTRRPKRRRPTDSGQQDDFGQKRATPVSVDSNRRQSVSSTRSVCLSSEEEEPVTSVYHQTSNGTKLNPLDTSTPPSSVQSSRKRHSRKPTRLSNGITQQPLNISVKNEPGDATAEHRPTGKKRAGLLTTSGHPSTGDYKGIDYTFRSLVPPHSQMSDADLPGQHNSSSPLSSNEHTRRDLFSPVIRGCSFRFSHFHTFVPIVISDTALFNIHSQSLHSQRQHEHDANRWSNHDWSFPVIFRWNEQSASSVPNDTSNARI